MIKISLVGYSSRVDDIIEWIFDNDIYGYVNIDADHYCVKFWFEKDVIAFKLKFG